jgi:hypothetical protein
MLQIIIRINKCSTWLCTTVLCRLGRATKSRVTDVVMRQVTAGGLSNGCKGGLLWVAAGGSVEELVSRFQEG